MSQIKDKEQAKEQGEWTNMTPEQRQEAEMSLRQLSMIARYHNVMGNHTIHMLELLTREIKTIFCHNSMVDRISGMLNYFLVNLVSMSKNFIEYENTIKKIYSAKLLGKQIVLHK